MDAPNRPADYLWASLMLRAILHGTKDWKVRQHGQVKTIRDAIRMSERLYIRGMGWR